MITDPLTHPAASPVSVTPLVAVLRQLADLLEGMTDEQYRTRPVGFSSSIGGHVRHCLDHVDALLVALDRGRINYDDRRRGGDVETSRLAALAALGRQEVQLLSLPALAEERPLRLTVLLSGALPAFEFGTTAGRELAFVLSHTIHHNALVGVMAQALGVPTPERFGYAPSTIAHLEKSAWA